MKHILCVPAKWAAPALAVGALAAPTAPAQPVQDMHSPDARADAVAHLSGSERNFVALLRPVSGEPAHAFGVVLFRQPHDAEKVVFLDVWTLGLAPNHGYLLQRATETPVDDACTGANWLTLGQGLEPQAIDTNELGFGRAHLFRDLATVPDGTRFDIQLRVIDSVTQDVVLVSSCHQFTVTP